MFSENKGQTREQNKCVKVQNKIWPVFYGYVSLVVNTSLSFPHSWLITGFVTKLTWRVSQVEQELPTLLDHLSSPLVFSGVRVTRSLVLYVYFVDRCLSFCTFSFGHCVVCSSSIYRFWLPLWYPQTILMVPDLVYKFKISCFKGTKVIEWKPNVEQMYEQTYIWYN